MAKEFKTLDELIELMQSRGMITDENTKGQLSRESYYAVVNGYKLPFLDRKAMKASSDDVYLEGTRFQWIFTLFSFDRDLRAITFKYLAQAEAIMKNAVVYEFCKANPNPSAYLAISSYASASEMLFAKGFRGNKTGIHQQSITRLMRILSAKAGGSDGKRFIEHYINCYGFVPLWVLSNDLTFGQVSHFYQLQKRSIQNRTCKAIAEGIGSNHRIMPQELLHAFSVLVEFRNICAHDERLYCAKVGKSRDIGYYEMARILSAILPESEFNSFRAEVGTLFARSRDSLHVVTQKSLLRDMGFDAAGRTGI